MSMMLSSSWTLHIPSSSMHLEETGTITVFLPRTLDMEETLAYTQAPHTGLYNLISNLLQQQNLKSCHAMHRNLYLHYQYNYKYKDSLPNTDKHVLSFRQKVYFKFPQICKINFGSTTIQSNTFIARHR